MSEDKEIRIDKVRELLREKGDSLWPGGDENTANVIRERRYLSEPVSDEEAKRRMSAMSRRGFLVGGAAALSAVFGWRWMPDTAKEYLFQGAFALNEQLSQILYRPSRLAPEFSPDQITEARINGMEGLESERDAEEFLFVRTPGYSEARIVTLEQIKSLPRTEMITQLKCIEGWSTIVHWVGVRFSDFVAHVGLTHFTDYVALATPDEKYFVGWDMPSIMHPQTLLAYEMNGSPLTLEHGAPLRIASPTKYGIKQIKRIGSIEFTDSRPKDFWAEYGYDWYSGH